MTILWFYKHIMCRREISHKNYRKNFVDSFYSFIFQQSLVKICWFSQIIRWITSILILCISCAKYSHIFGRTAWKQNIYLEFHTADISYILIHVNFSWQSQMTFDHGKGNISIFQDWERNVRINFCENAARGPPTLIRFQILSLKHLLTTFVENSELISNFHTKIAEL